MGLVEAMELFKKGRLDEVLLEIHHEETHIEAQLLKGLILSTKGHFNTTLHLANQVLKENTSIVNLMTEFKARVLKFYPLIVQSKWQEMYEEIIEAENLLKKVNEPFNANDRVWIAFLKGWKGFMIEIFFGDIDTAMELLQQAVEINMEVENYLGIAWALNFCSEVHFFEGHLKESKEYAEQGLAMSEKYEIDFTKAHSCILNGRYYLSVGQLKSAQNWLQKGVDISALNENKYIENSSRLYLGITYLHLGKIEKSLEELEESIQISETIGDHYGKARSILNIGTISQINGDIQQAIDLFQQAFRVFRTFKDTNRSIDANLKLGKAYMALGENKLAYEEFKNSFIHRLWNWEDNRPNNGIPQNLYAFPETLYQLVIICLELNLFDQAEHYQQRLEDLQDLEPNDLVHYQAKLAKALILKQNKRIKEKIKSQIYLEELINDKIEDQGLVVYAMLAYCDMLVAELKLYNEMEVFQEIEILMSQLLRIVQEQSSIPLEIETILLQANLALIRGEASETSQILNQALRIAEKHKLPNFIEKVKDRQFKLSGELGKWKELTERNAPLQERLELVKIQQYIAEAQKVAETSRRDSYSH
ncbi:MAG: tetratricopeptide repeat protein [Candidatus Hodarchaeales archaeon]|jgi:tetratricopeptide (TPR) repeat protein